MSPIEALAFAATVVAFRYSLRRLGPFRPPTTLREYMERHDLRILPATLLAAVLVAWVAAIVVRLIGIDY